MTRRNLFGWLPGSTLILVLCMALFGPSPAMATTHFHLHPGPAEWRCGYAITGDARIAPDAVCTDGRETYLRFKNGKSLPEVYIRTAIGRAGAQSKKTAARDEVVDTRQLSPTIMDVDAAPAALDIRIGSRHATARRLAITPPLKYPTFTIPGDVNLAVTPARTTTPLPKGLLLPIVLDNAVGRNLSGNEIAVVSRTVYGPHRSVFVPRGANLVIALSPAGRRTYGCVTRIYMNGNPLTLPSHGACSAILADVHGTPGLPAPSAQGTLATIRITRDLPGALDLGG